MSSCPRAQGDRGAALANKYSCTFGILSQPANLGLYRLNKNQLMVPGRSLVLVDSLRPHISFRGTTMQLFRLSFSARLFFINLGTRILFFCKGRLTVACNYLLLKQVADPWDGQTRVNLLHSKIFYMENNVLVHFRNHLCLQTNKNKQNKTKDALPVRVNCKKSKHVLNGCTCFRFYKVIKF